MYMYIHSCIHTHYNTQDNIRTRSVQVACAKLWTAHPDGRDAQHTVMSLSLSIYIYIHIYVIVYM